MLGRKGTSDQSSGEGEGVVREEMEGGEGRDKKKGEVERRPLYRSKGESLGSDTKGLNFIVSLPTGLSPSLVGRRHDSKGREEGRGKEEGKREKGSGD